MHLLHNGLLPGGCVSTGMATQCQHRGGDRGGDKEPKRTKRRAGRTLMFTGTHNSQGDSNGSRGGDSAEVDPRSGRELTATCGENEKLG